MFDMTNPNIYKSILPFVGYTGAAGAAVSQFQQGGTFSEDNPRDAMIKARLAYEYQRGNPAVLRMMSGHDNPHQFEDGATGTHYMASMDNYAVPLIQDKDGNLVLGDYGPESKEAIQFDSPEDAEYFAENYKKFAPALKNYEDGGTLEQDPPPIYVTQEEFDAVLDRWVNRDLFEKIDGRWQPTFSTE